MRSRKPVTAKLSVGPTPGWQARALTVGTTCDLMTWAITTAAVCSLGTGVGMGHITAGLLVTALVPAVDSSMATRITPCNSCSCGLDRGTAHLPIALAE